MGTKETKIPDGINDKKKSLRKEMKDFRDQLNPQWKKLADRRITEYFTGLSLFEEADRIYTYVSFGSECSTRELIDFSLKAGKEVAVPRVEGSVMNFYRIYSMDDMTPGVWGILEPLSDMARVTGPGLMAVPGLAFDRKGCRLGYGGGYYDKYLAGNSGIHTIGLAYDGQLTDDLPVEDCDRPVDGILTESGLIFHKEGKKLFFPDDTEDS